ncbi:MAG: TatD family hydrolase [Bacteroidaceae bacterium]|nr:TatD family hydrolase [Bacteroidaceae bacterium]
MIDTHSHIYGPEFDEDRDLVVQRAREAGVECILLPNINAETIRPMLSLCAAYPRYYYPMMGLHPEDVREDYQQVLRAMRQELQHPRHPFIAIGEVGLDFYWDETYRTQQLDAFEQQVCWARDLGLPLVIHTRSAHRELVEVMERHRQERLTGIFHCFGGTREEAVELLSFDGFVLGIGGVLTYKKSALPEVLRSVPLERIVLETDAPYLAPVPHRGKRNESAYVVHTLQRLAEVYECTPETVDEVTTKTAKRIFDLP